MADAVLPWRVAAQQPVPQPLAVHGTVGQRVGPAAQQLPGDLPVLYIVQLPRHIGGHRVGEPLRLRRLPRPAAEPEMVDGS